MPNTSWLRISDTSRFVEELMVLPPASWCSIGVLSRRNDFARAFALRRLLALAEGAEVQVWRWRVDDEVETIGWYTLRAAAAMPADHHREVREAVRAARVAVLAVLLRLRLGEHRFQILYAPFESHVPRVRLAG